MATITVAVTEALIRGGTPGRCESCPVALAINLKLRAPLRSYVGGAWIDIVTPGGAEMARVPTPPELFRWMSAFDREGDAEPAEFALDLPGQVLSSYVPIPGP